MNKPNHHKKMLEIINNLSCKKKLLLHSCCAPCSSYCLELLKNVFDITIFFYNPNIYSQAEFQKRLTEQKRLIKEMNLNIDVITPEYNMQEFLDTSKGYENLIEGDKRCYNCYFLRLQKTAESAKNNFDFFTTTLSISPLKNAEWINTIGSKLEMDCGVKFLPSDFKKDGGYQKSVILSKKHNLYRQNFCGCLFSKKDTQKE
ncbi:MAG: epoxyqueuosine reductase QueH [Bacillota bacterium]